MASTRWILTRTRLEDKGREGWGQEWLDKELLYREMIFSFVSFPDSFVLGYEPG